MYGFNVSMYKNPPSGHTDIMETVQMAIERLKLYKMLNDAKSESVEVEYIKWQLRDSPLLFLLEESHNRLVEKARIIDYHSHWILRVAYSQNHWDFHFVKYELLWFQCRFSLMNELEQTRFMEANNFNLSQATDMEKTDLKIDTETAYYKCKFFEVPSLVKLRKNPIHNGYIYFKSSDRVHWLLYRLEQELKTSFTHINKLMPTIQDDQLNTILSFLTLVKPTHSYQAAINHVNLEELDDKAESNFPLCMRFQHETLRKTHHLKHFSRRQYGLFLKGIGLPLDGALNFWKDEFEHNMTEERFRKKYSYSIKHMYGTVGGKIDYHPFNCQQIINYMVNPNQINGCPFKHWSDEVLRTKLKEYSVPNYVIESIVSLQEAEMFQEACTKYFEHVHGCSLDEVIEHPNQYYLCSCKREEVDIEDLFAGDSD